MRFPRNVKIFRGQLDAAPWASLFFLLLLFFLLQSSLFFTPGIHLELPEGEGFVDVTNPSVVIMMDLQGQYYFDQQQISAADLLAKLRKIVAASPAPMTLKVLMDGGITMHKLGDLSLLARQAEFHDLHLPTRPRIDPAASPDISPSNDP